MVEVLRRYSKIVKPTQFDAQSSGPPVPLASRSGRGNQRCHRLSADNRANLIKDYQSGIGTKALAEKYKIHRSTVSAVLVRSGVPLRQRGLLEDQVREAIGLYEQGWSLTRLSERFAVDEMTVRARLLQANVTMRKPWERGSM